MDLYDLNLIVKQCLVLKNIFVSCFGPCAMDRMVNTPLKKILITKLGKFIMDAIHVEHPIVTVIIKSILKHESIYGDGSKSFAIILYNVLVRIHDFINKTKKNVKYSKAFMLRSLKFLRSEVFIKLLEPKIFILSFKNDDEDIKNVGKIIKRLVYSNLIVQNSKSVSCHLTSLLHKVLTFQNKTPDWRSMKIIASSLLFEFENVCIESIDGPPENSKIENKFILSRNFVTYHPKCIGSLRSKDLKFIILCDDKSDETGFVIEIENAESALAMLNLNFNKWQRISQQLSNNDIDLVICNFKITDDIKASLNQHNISSIQCLSDKEINRLSSSFNIIPLSDLYILLNINNDDGIINNINNNNNNDNDYSMADNRLNIINQTQHGFIPTYYIGRISNFGKTQLNDVDTFAYLEPKQIAHNDDDDNLCGTSDRFIDEAVISFPFQLIISGYSLEQCQHLIYQLERCVKQIDCLIYTSDYAFNLNSEKITSEKIERRRITDYRPNSEKFKQHIMNNTDNDIETTIINNKICHNIKNDSTKHFAAAYLPSAGAFEVLFSSILTNIIVHIKSNRSSQFSKKFTETDIKLIEIFREAFLGVPQILIQNSYASKFDRTKLSSIACIMNSIEELNKSTGDDCYWSPSECLINETKDNENFKVIVVDVRSGKMKLDHHYRNHHYHRHNTDKLINDCKNCTIDNKKRWNYIDIDKNYPGYIENASNDDAYQFDDDDDDGGGDDDDGDDGGGGDIFISIEPLKCKLGLLEDVMNVVELILRIESVVPVRKIK